jgi:DNA-binding MarR family transcriptional regulator
MESNNSQDVLVEHIFSLGRLIRERLSTDSSCAPLLHLATLQFIAERQPRMREIADYLRITPPSATSLVNALAKSGQIRRESDKNDRRTVRLTITSRGQKSLDDGMRQKRSVIGSVITRLTESERDDLKKILGKLTSASA